ncbi:hypothetical protein BV898_02098 [Hypsibius exemplaris]|uniref:Uncharacterized protein n=1 Tax=Hypsibius exemplaris TaxID=2072580 RepID=A0A1W0X9R7_HYPEX|nr:hypothetical protein BV898_02098 [Hypsibius exemplaris]
MYHKDSHPVCWDKAFARYHSSPASGIVIFIFSFKAPLEDVTGANFFILYKHRDGRSYRDPNNEFGYGLMVVPA